MLIDGIEMKKKCYKYVNWHSGEIIVDKSISNICLGNCQNTSELFVCNYREIAYSTILIDVLNLDCINVHYVTDSLNIGEK